MAKRNTSDLRRSSSGNSPLSFSTMDDGNKPAQNVRGVNAENEVAPGSEEDREVSRAAKKDPQAEGLQKIKKILRSTNQGSSTSESKEWAQDEVIKNARTPKHGD